MAALRLEHASVQLQVRCDFTVTTTLMLLAQHGTAEHSTLDVACNMCLSPSSGPINLAANLTWLALFAFPGALDPSTLQSHTLMPLSTTCGANNLVDCG